MFSACKDWPWLIEGTKPILPSPGRDRAFSSIKKNSDGCGSRYRSAASRTSTRANGYTCDCFIDGLCEAVVMVQYTRTELRRSRSPEHLYSRPWKKNDRREALTILRSGSESLTARSLYFAGAAVNEISARLAMSVSYTPTTPPPARKYWHSST